jgi:hypothetical protein
MNLFESYKRGQSKIILFFYYYSKSSQRLCMPLYVQAKLNMLCSSFNNNMNKDLQQQRQQIL